MKIDLTKKDMQIIYDLIHEDRYKYETSYFDVRLIRIQNKLRKAYNKKVKVK